MKCYNCNEELTRINAVTAYTPYETHVVCIDCSRLIRDGGAVKPLLTVDDYNNLPDYRYLPNDVYLIAKVAQDVFRNLDVDSYTKRVKAVLKSFGPRVDCQVLFTEIRALLLSGVTTVTDDELWRIYQSINVCALEILTDIPDYSKDTEECLLDSLHSLCLRHIEKFPKSSLFSVGYVYLLP